VLNFLSEKKTLVFSLRRQKKRSPKTEQAQANPEFYVEWVCYSTSFLPRGLLLKWSHILIINEKSKTTSSTNMILIIIIAPYVFLKYTFFHVCMNALCCVCNMHCGLWSYVRAEENVFVDHFIVYNFMDYKHYLCTQIKGPRIQCIPMSTACSKTCSSLPCIHVYERWAGGWLVFYLLNIKKSFFWRHTCFQLFNGPTFHFTSLPYISSSVEIKLIKSQSTTYAR